MNSQVTNSGRRCDSITPTLNRSCGAVNCLQLEDSHSTSVLAGLRWSLLERIYIDPHRHTPVPSAGVEKLMMGRKSRKFVCHQYRGVDGDDDCQLA